MAAQPVLVVFTSHGSLLNGKPTGYYLPEIAHPYYRLKKAGFKLIAASPAGGEPPLDPSSVEAFKDDPESKEFLNDKEAQDWVKNTVKLSEIKDVSDYSAYFAPGEHTLRVKQ